MSQSCLNSCDWTPGLLLSACFDCTSAENLSVTPVSIEVTHGREGCFWPQNSKIVVDGNGIHFQRGPDDTIVFSKMFEYMQEEYINYEGPQRKRICISRNSTIRGDVRVVIEMGEKEITAVRAKIDWGLHPDNHRPCLSTEVFVQDDQDSTRAYPLESTDPLHAVVKKIFTGVAYGDRVWCDLFSPIVGHTVSPSPDTYRTVQHLFRQYPPPTICLLQNSGGNGMGDSLPPQPSIYEVESGPLARTPPVRALPSVPSLTPDRLRAGQTIESVIDRTSCYGLHMRQRAPKALTICIGADVVDLLKATRDVSDNPDAQESIDCAKAIVVVTLVHELAHWVGTVHNIGAAAFSSPPRASIVGADAPRFETCCDRKGAIEAGELAEELWTGVRLKPVRQENGWISMMTPVFVDPSIPETEEDLLWIFDNPRLSPGMSYNFVPHSFVRRVAEEVVFSEAPLIDTSKSRIMYRHAVTPKTSRSTMNEKQSPVSPSPLPRAPLLEAGSREGWRTMVLPKDFFAHRPCVSHKDA